MSIIDLSSTDAKSILSEPGPLTTAQRLLVLDRIYQLERGIAAIQHEACVAARDRDALLALITSDSHAVSFQSLSHYRASLLQISDRSETINETIYRNQTEQLPRIAAESSALSETI